MPYISRFQEPQTLTSLGYVSEALFTDVVGTTELLLVVVPGVVVDWVVTALGLVEVVVVDRLLLTAEVSRGGGE